MATKVTTKTEPETTEPEDADAQRDKAWTERLRYVPPNTDDAG